MSLAKTQINLKLIEDFLGARGVSIASIRSIEDGETSRAYYFTDKTNEKVLRVNSTSNEGFIKDKFAAEHFASKAVPIPVIDEIGTFMSQGMYFAISDRVPGKTLDTFSKNEINDLMPEIISVADAIHTCPPAGEGYGWWQSKGNGKYDSWQEALDGMQRADDDDTLAFVPFFEKDLHEKLISEITTYYTYCPNDRYLVHGDYGFNNTLSDGRKITGVIDWNGSMYGDPLWDVAWLDFWHPYQGYAASFKQHYENKNKLPANFNERVMCYRLINGLTSMCFFAKSNQPEKYAYSKNIVANIGR